MKDDFKLLRGFADRQTEKWTDICDCRVALATEKLRIQRKTNENRMF